MITPPIPHNESGRLEALKSYEILDTMPESDYDDITQLASEICGTPMSLVTLVDKHRQWFKSKIGFEDNETAREHSFCAHAIARPEEIMIVSDSHKDERFRENPYVSGDPHVAFYAGIPLVTTRGNALGTLCVLDVKPRQLSSKQLSALKALANQVVNILELRRKRIQFEAINKQLEKYSFTVAHDLKSPIAGIKGVLELMNDNEHVKDSADLKEYVSLLHLATARLDQKIEMLLNDALQIDSAEKKDVVGVGALVEDIVAALLPPPHFKFIIHRDLPSLKTNKVKLTQVFENLITNAIKYNDKEQAIVEIGSKEEDWFYSFFVKDNGVGIQEKDQERIFQQFETTTNQSGRDSSTGLGLSFVKQLVEEQGGTITVSSEVGKGSCFTFKWPSRN